MEATRHTFSVFDAGEVEIERDGDEIRASGVIASEGWTFEEAIDEDGQLEIQFNIHGREAEFEAEIDDGRLKIEIEQTWLDAPDGSYEVGEAGEVQVSRMGDELNLVEVRPNAGWEYTVDEPEDDKEENDAVPSIAVEFRRGEVTAEFEAELNGGKLEVEVEIEFYADARA